MRNSLTHWTMIRFVRRHPLVHGAPDCRSPIVETSRNSSIINLVLRSFIRSSTVLRSFGCSAPTFVLVHASGELISNVSIRRHRLDGFVWIGGANEDSSIEQITRKRERIFFEENGIVS